MTDSSEPKGWHSRGYLPHFDGGEIAQFLTFRLAGSLPQHILTRYKDQLRLGFISESDYHRAVDRYLDRPGPEDFLRVPAVAAVVAENLQYFDGLRYRLHAWVVMPNHGHVLLTPKRGNQLSSIVHSIESYTATRANEILGRSGPFWAPEYFDRYIRDDEHFGKAVAYIHNNPVKAGLCDRPENWPFSSAAKQVDAGRA